MEATTFEIVPGFDIDDEVTRLYNTTSKTMREISEELGVSYSRVHSRINVLLRRGVLNRRRGA